MKILFVCKHNKFRSKVAEAIFKKLNKNKEIKAKSKGVLLDEDSPYVAPIVVKFMKERGYIIGGKPKKIKINEINKYDLLIIVADNVDSNFFISFGFKGKIVKWKIPDCDETDYKCIKKDIDEIEKKIKELIYNL